MFFEYNPGTLAGKHQHLKVSSREPSFELGVQVRRGNNMMSLPMAAEYIENSGKMVLLEEQPPLGGRRESMELLPFSNLINYFF